MDDEMRLHLELRAEDLMRSGVPAEEAVRRARAEFGNVTAARERGRATWTWAWLEQLGQDLRHAVRTLRHSPVLTLVAVLSLAIGIGSTTTVFGVVDALVLRQLPVAAPAELVTMKWNVGPTYDYGADSLDFARYRALDRVFSGVAGVEIVDRWNVALDRPAGAVVPGAVHVALVSGNYFGVLGVNMLLGSALSVDDDRVAGAHPVAVISQDFWRRQFAGATDIVGRAFRLNGEVYTIRGVAQSGFAGDWIGRPTDLWIPLAMRASAAPDAKGGRFDIRIIARLRRDITPAGAETAAQAAYAQILRDRILTGNYPPAVQQMWARRVELESVANGYSPQRKAFARPLFILTALVALVLVIACANVAGLLLARAAARSREMAVRRALGARTGRIRRLFLTESVVLALVGGLVGTLFAWWGTHVLALFVRNGPAPFLGSEGGPADFVLSLDVNPDARLIAFSFAVSLLTGVLFGLAPAARAARTSLASALTTRGSGGGGAGRRGLGRGLVVAQVAVSVLMLVGAGLFGRTLQNLKSQDLGFDRRHLLLVWTDPSQLSLSGAPLTALWHAVQDRLSLLPGVRSASVTNMGLLNGFEAMTGSEFFAPPGRDPRPGQRLVNTKVTPGFFETVGIPLVEGRDFTRFDTDSTPPVVILNETMARFYFGSTQAIGQRLDFVRPHSYPPYQVVGVVTDTKNSLREGKTGVIYYPSAQHYGGRLPTMIVAVRATGEPAPLARAVRQAVHEINADLPILQIDTVDDQADVVLSRERLLSALAAFFGAVAMLLSCLGIYGVIAYSTARRASEIGIRMALGASRAGVLAMVLRESLVLVVVGLAIGIPATLAASRLVTNQLYGVRAADPATIVIASLLLLGAAILAALGPARRAARVDPMTALRAEA
jgi:predicted permease